MKLRKLSSQKNIDSIEKYDDESNQTDVSNNKKSDGRYQISKIEEEKVTEDTEVLKLGKLSSHKNIDSIEKYFDEGNSMDMSDDKDSVERY